jgi:hypothetical protein
VELAARSLGAGSLPWRRFADIAEGNVPMIGFGYFYF